MSNESVITELKRAFYEQNQEKCAAITQRALDAGIDPIGWRS